jgi:hypothetical protein
MAGSSRPKASSRWHALDRAALEAGGVPPDILSHAHGESFLRFFVAGRGSTSSMSPSRPCPGPARSSSSSSYVGWTDRPSAKSS